MEEPAVRWFRLEDAEAVVALHEGNKEWFEEVNLTREFVLASSERPDFKFMVAEADGEVVGFVGALFFESVGRAEVGPIGLKQEYQNHGVGTRFLASMMEFLQGVGIHRLIVHVKANNLNAIKFFLNAGFVFEAYLREYTRNREDVVQMVRLLNPNR